MKIRGYTQEDLMKMDIASLRGLLHERTHHTIEVMIYRILNGKLEKPASFGNQARQLLDIWKDRGLPTDTPDFEWCAEYVKLADKLNRGETIQVEAKLPEPFTDAEMEIVNKLIYERRSIRQFANRKVSEEVIRKILHAGLYAPQGCNLDARRFIVLRKPEEWKLVTSDIPIENGVMILVCQDMSVYKTLRFDRFVPQNIYFDAAASATVICLMAHALGLGACWLTHGEETQEKIRQYFQLPQTFVSRIHIIMGWPNEAPIKSLRMSLDDAIIRKIDQSIDRSITRVITFLSFFH